MNTVLLAVITTAVSIGLGCGTCCSPIIGTFLSSYVVSHSGGVKKGILSFISFFLGKLIGVTLLCVIASLLSSRFIDEQGYIGEFNLRLTAQIMMSAIGIVMVIRWIRESRIEESCHNCHECKKSDNRSGFLSMLMVGFTYGITPCAPLLLIIGYAFTLNVLWAGITGMVFSLASMMSPILLLVVITGALSKKMQKEIPDYIRWFRLSSYILLIVVPFLFQQN